MFSTIPRFREETHSKWLQLNALVLHEDVITGELGRDVDARSTVSSTRTALHCLIMSPESEFIQMEIPEIAQIFRDECWLEGERRGTAVDPKDEVVQSRVAEIILSGVGARLRQGHR
jgi:hypothetical protein